MFKKSHLKNGIRLLTVPLKSTNTVTVMVFVGTGCKNEQKSENGISHFVEHVMFKGTEKRPDTLAISGELDAVGAEFNAYTGSEQTVYYVKADFTHLDLAMDILSDMLFNSKFDANEIEKEKGVVIEEMNMYEDKPMASVGDLMDKLLYGDQPAGRRVLGSKETVKAISRQKILNYIKNHYCADNMIVCVAGNFPEKTIKAKAEKYFKYSLSKKSQKKTKTKENQKSPQSLIHFKETDQTHLLLAYRSFIDAFNPKRFTLSLLSNILGGNMSSRLSINIREKLGLAYYVYAGADTSFDTGYLYMKAGVDNTKVELAIKEILNQCDLIKKEGVLEKELQRAKDYFRGKTLIDLESSDELAGFFGGQEIMDKKILTPKELLVYIDKVKASDIHNLAKEIFQPKNLNLALIGPFRERGKFNRLLKI